MIGEEWKEMTMSYTSDDGVFVLFALLALAVAAAALVYAVWVYRKGERAKRVFSSIQLFTMGIFLSAALMFVPIYYVHYDFGDSWMFLRPFLLSVHNSLRIFILDDDFKIVLDAVADRPEALRIGYTLYAALLYVTAPILTFSNVLSLFKNVTNELRYRLCFKKGYSFYVMSELNPKSVALAKSILKRDPKAVLVFTDVFEQNAEDDYELLTEVRDLNAICFKKDIAHLNIYSKKGNAELFMIGEDEAENVSQAVKITKELNRRNHKQNVKIFVFSRNHSTAMILDSLKYDNLLKFAAKHQYDDRSFKLRCINEIRQLVWNTVPNMKLFDIASKHDNTLSVLIVGMGLYGMEFFKTLIWYCQFAGYKLTINVLDKQTDGFDGQRDIRSLIDRRCPDLLKTNRSNEDGEAYYDIEIFSGVDLNTSTLKDMLTYQGKDVEKQRVADRLKATNVAIVALGDDDINIDAATYLRSLFDRIGGVKATDTIRVEDEAVQLYAVVYDEHKSGILHAVDEVSQTRTTSDKNVKSDGNVRFFVNHKNIPYNIHFIGGMSSQFAYSNIYDAELEKAAYRHHIGWIAIEEKIHEELVAKGKTEELNSCHWYFEDAKTDDKEAEERQKYERFEYYRHSSMAKELYRREIESNAVLKTAVSCEKQEGMQTCECEHCKRRKKSEHMRWNAYTRTIGYSYQDGRRADRAKLHADLIPWGSLSPMEQLKDDVIYPNDRNANQSST